MLAAAGQGAVVVTGVHVEAALTELAGSLVEWWTRAHMLSPVPSTGDPSRVAIAHKH